MPIYEYRCHHCGHSLEKLQKISDAPLTDCPICKKPELRKKVSAAGFQLKGTGWYVTDFKNNSGANKQSSVAAGEGGAGSSSSGLASTSAGTSGTSSDK